jgi:ABC-type molybdenum transport system ATPase subunit/photorepair protein PhrA
MDSVETLIVLSTPVQQNNPTLLKRFAQYQKQRAEADRLRNSVASGITKSDGKTQERVSRMQEEQSQKVADFLAVTTFGSVVVKEEKEKDIQQQ